MATGAKLMLALILLFMSFGTAVAVTDPQVCYILDGILFLYGIILSALYCRLKILNSKATKAKKMEPVGDGVYMGLGPQDQSPYETIALKK